MSDRQYYSNYADSHDIDCFFRIGRRAFHFASNGNPIPWFISRVKNNAVQVAVYEMLENAQWEVDVHRDTIRRLIQNEFDGITRDLNVSFDAREGIDRMIDDYASSFESMARKGFISMDLDERGVFHIIATPTNHELDSRIMSLLPEVQEGSVVIYE